MADTDLTIDIDAPEDQVQVTTEAPVKPATEVVEKAAPDAEAEGIESLRAQLETFKSNAETEKAARTRAEADAARQRTEAAEARKQLEKVQTDSADHQFSAVESSIAAAQAEADSAERDYRTAFEAGDSAKAAESQRKMARAEAKVLRLEESRADLEARKAEPPQRTEEPARPQPTQADPFEAAIAGSSPRTQAWLRKNPTFVTDEKLNRKANAAHNMALADGYIPDSDAYFDFCERFLGLKEATATEDVDPAPKPRQRKPAMPAAPVSRDASPSNGNLSNGQIVLTPGEQRAATDGTHVHNYDDPAGKFKKGDPIGLREMARRKALMQADGRYTSNYTDQ